MHLYASKYLESGSGGSAWGVFAATPARPEIRYGCTMAYDVSNHFATSTTHLQRLHVHEERAHNEPPVVEQVEAGQLALLGVADGDLDHLAVDQALHRRRRRDSFLNE